jgi:hypothetical protein
MQNITSQSTSLLGDGVAGARQVSSDCLRLGEDGAGATSVIGTCTNWACKRAICFRISACLLCSSSCLLDEESMVVTRQRVICGDLAQYDRMNPVSISHDQIGVSIFRTPGQTPIAIFGQSGRGKTSTRQCFEDSVPDFTVRKEHHAYLVSVHRFSSVKIAQKGLCQFLLACHRSMPGHKDLPTKASFRHLLKQCGAGIPSCFCTSIFLTHSHSTHILLQCTALQLLVRLIWTQPPLASHAASHL